MRALVIKVRQRAAHNAGGYISKGELSDEKLRRLNGWYDDSYRHEAFGALAARVLAASDLSQLYFRELYLDMTRQVQFPVDLNLPLLPHQVLPEAGAHCIACNLITHQLGNGGAAGPAGSTRHDAV